MIMRISSRFMVLLILVSSLLGQNYGLMKAPANEDNSDEMQAMLALKSDLALEKTIDPDLYILGPGDELGLNIQSSINQTLPLTITPTGDLFIPAVGVCHVGGFSLAEGKEVVREFVLNMAFPGAKVDMVLVHPRYFLLQVYGAVNKPGFIAVTPLTRLDAVIHEAGEFHQLAEEFNILITRSTGVSEVINYHEYVLTGDLNSNPTFLEGDKILVPFGGLDKNGIVVRGSIAGAGYDIISEGESLGRYIRRQIVFRDNADLRNITLTRTSNGVSEHMVITPSKFDETILKAQDAINFMWERGITVTGFVQLPGGFSYFPGYSASDYVALAGGNSINGNPTDVTVRHKDGKISTGLDTVIIRGDVIYVPRTKKDIYLGKVSVLQIVTSLATIYLTFLSTQK